MSCAENMSILRYPRFDILELMENLVYARIWAEKNLDVNNIYGSLRSHFLSPDTAINLCSVEDEMKLNSVRNLAKKRADFIGETKSYDFKKTPGRVLVYIPIRCLGDALVASECDDFIDEDDIPAWDMWLQFLPSFKEDDYEVDACLLCYVPQELVEKVNLAIQVYCYDGFRWATEIEEEIAKLNYL